MLELMSDDDPKTELVLPSPRAALEKVSGVSGLQALEQKLVTQSATIIEDALRFTEWPVDDPDAQKATYELWLDTEGPEVANRRRSAIVAAWASKKDAPVGLDIARSILVADMKASATRDSGTKVLNVQRIEFAAPKMDDYPEMEVKE
jgi:hypothetical protein